MAALRTLQALYLHLMWMATFRKQALTTVGAIKDKLRLLRSNVKKGDEIFFYYNGHGIPGAQNNNEPYILASDKVSDFVTCT